MVIRRSMCGNLARDSFFSDIIMPTDSVFTPPVAPPPPYSPPDYMAISNDRVLVESNEFMDDLSTPTPVIGPLDMPPPYSMLDLSPGGTTMECAQEYQVEPTEVNHIENRRPSSQTAVSNSYNPGRAIITVYRRNSSEQVPAPPLRWDSHHVGWSTPVSRMEQSSGCSSSGTTVEPCLPAVHIINNNCRHVKGKSRPRSGGSPRPCHQPHHHHRHRETRNSLPQIISQSASNNPGLIILDSTRQAQSAGLHTNGSCLPVVIMRHHRGRPAVSTAPGNHRVSTASQTSLEENDKSLNVRTVANVENITVGNHIIPSIPCSSNHPNQTSSISATEYANRFSIEDDNKPSGKPFNARTTLMNRKASSSSGSVSGPNTVSVPSLANSKSSSTSSSHTSRDSPVGRKQKRRHSRHAAEQRRRASSSATTCSTSPTDCSSKSSTSGSYGRGRWARNKYLSSSSSSDSDEAHRYPPQPRRLIARMANGTIRHEMLDAQVAVPVRREHRKNSGSSAGTPPRSRARHAKASRDRLGSGGTGIRSADSLSVASNMQGAAHLTVATQNVPSPSTAAEEVNFRQKRPNSLNLRLSRQSHPAVQQPRSSNLSAISYAEGRDPWIHRDDGPTYTSVGVQSTPGPLPNRKGPLSVGFQAHNDCQHMNESSLAPPLHSAASAPTPSTEPLSSVPTMNTKPRPKSMVELGKDTGIIVSRFLQQSTAGLSPAIKTVLEDIHSVITTDEQYLLEAMQSHNIIDAYIEKTNSIEKMSKDKSGSPECPSGALFSTEGQSTDPKHPNENNNTTASDLPQEKTAGLNLSESDIVHLPTLASPSSCKELLKQTLEVTSREILLPGGVLPITETKFLCHSCPDAAIIGAEETKSQEVLLQSCLVKTLESARETVL